MDSSSFVTQSSTLNSHGSQWNQKDNDWFVSNSQRTHSRHLQPSLINNGEEEADFEDEVVAQNSPELFTQRGEFHLHGAPFNVPELGVEDSEGTINSLKSYACFLDI